MVFIFNLVIVVHFLILSSVAKRFELCEIVYELREQGFQEHLIKHLICLIQESSMFQSHLISGPDHDGAYEYGLFQIHERWCSPSAWNWANPSQACNVRCRDLVLDNITIASSCVRHILETEGLKAWSNWLTSCREHELPDYYC